MIVIEWEQREKMIDRKVIAKVEEHLGIKFPQDYVEWAKKYHGGGPKNIEAFIDSGKFKGMSFYMLCSYNPEAPYHYILEDYEIYVKEAKLPDKLIPFGVDSGENLYYFDFRDGIQQPKIVWHDKDFHPDEYPESLVYICDTFTQFLSMLYDEE